MLLFFMTALVGQFNFSSSVSAITFNLEVPQYGIQKIQLGFIDTSRAMRFGYFCAFTVMILMIRGYLKKCKYGVKSVINKISNRSVMMFNVHRKATVNEILEAFNQEDIE